MNSPRLDLLRSYVLTLLAEGQFTSSSYGEVLSKASALLAQDLPQVVGEIGLLAGRQIAEKGMRATGELVLGAMRRAVDSAMKNGFKSVWRDISAAYERGARAQRGR